MTISSDRVKAWRHRSKERMQKLRRKLSVVDIMPKEALAFHHIDPSQKELAFGRLRANPNMEQSS
jgi:hypothetical protein